MRMPDNMHCYQIYKIIKLPTLCCTYSLPRGPFTFLSHWLPFLCVWIMTYSRQDEEELMKDDYQSEWEWNFNKISNTFEIGTHNL